MGSVGRRTEAFWLLPRNREVHRQIRIGRCTGDFGVFLCKLPQPHHQRLEFFVLSDMRSYRGTQGLDRLPERAELARTFEI